MIYPSNNKKQQQQQHNSTKLTISRTPSLLLLSFFLSFLCLLSFLHYWSDHTVIVASGETRTTLNRLNMPLFLL